MYEPEPQLDRIRQHIKVLNHSSERHAEELTQVKSSMARLETNQAWLMRLSTLLLSGMAALLIDLFANR